MVFLTVFTPAYNRASTLPRTYESLCDQECKEFIWLIVDDGSTGRKKKMDLKYNIFIKKMVECIQLIMLRMRIYIQN